MGYVPTQLWKILQHRCPDLGVCPVGLPALGPFPSLGLSFSLQMRHSTLLHVVSCQKALLCCRRNQSKWQMSGDVGEGTALPGAPPWEWSAPGP